MNIALFCFTLFVNLEKSLVKSGKILRLISLFTNPVVRSLQWCQSKMTCMAVTNRLAYANMLESTQKTAMWFKPSCV